MKNMMRQSCGAFLLSTMIVLSLGLFPRAASAANFVVSKTADTDDGACNSDCSLREAVYAANAAAGADTITFNPTVFAAPRKTIVPAWSINPSDSVTITAPAAGLVVSSSLNRNIFSVTNADAIVSIVGLTLSNGNTGVENEGTLTLTNCTMNGNNYGIINYGVAATLINCTLTGNGDAGLLNGRNPGGSGRYASKPSGGVTTRSDTSTATLTNCTVSENTAESGFGAGIWNNTGSTVTVKNSIVVGNDYDTYGDAVTNGGNNIIGGTATAAGLDPDGLQDNGGPSRTIALIAGSPALDTANDAIAPSTDQRGIARPQGTHSDIGAFEARVSLVIRDATAVEGNSSTTNIVFTVKLTLPATSTVTVNYATANGTAIAGTDYTAKSGTLSFAAGTTTVTFTVLGLGDTTIEPDETFLVNLSSAVGAPIADGQGTGTIVGDDNETPSLVVNTTSDVESRTDGLTSLRDAIAYVNSNNFDPGNITFDATVFAAPRKSITVNSLLTLSENVTITAPQAGVAIEGFTPLAGENPPNSIFNVYQCNASFNGLTISKGVYGIFNNAGQVTVTNCTLSDNTDSGIYNNSGGATLNNCTLTGSNFGFQGSYGGANLTNSTLSGNRFAGFSNNRGTATIRFCTVSGNPSGVKNDFQGGTINLNNSIVAGNTTNTEGPITYGTNNIATGTAAAAGLETDGSGQPILKDNDGPTKTIALIPGGAAVDAAADAGAPATDQRGYARPQGTHCDIGAFELAPMALMITDVTANEGNSGTTNFIFTVRLMRASTSAVSVNYATADGTATAGSDYTARSGTLTIPAGSFTATVTVSVAGNTTIEPDEVFYVNLSNAVGAPINDAQGAGTIITEDFETPSLVVTTTNDVVNNTDGVNSLREAIEFANIDGVDSAITFSATVFASPRKTITLGGEQLPTLMGVGDGSMSNVSITAPPAGVVINGNNQSGVFEFQSDVSVTLTGLTITGGNTDTGGAIRNFGTLLVDSCTLNGNSAGQGGAIYSYGNYNDTGATIVRNSTLSGNNAGAGGGIYTTANTRIESSTITGNTASANQGAGLVTPGDMFTTTSTTISNSIIAGNNGTDLDYEYPNQYSDSVVSGGYNIIGDGSAVQYIYEPGDVTGVSDPKLGALADNGGPTQTHALLIDSPALNAGNTPLTSDQRAITRPQGSADDIGAFETFVAPPASVQFSAASYSVNEGAGTATITVTRTGGTNAASVAYATGTGTATNPADYTATSGTLQFATGQSSRTFTVSIVNDTAIENSETINLTLSAPVGATLGTPATATLTIVDNDAVGYSISGRVVTSTGIAISGVSVSRGSGSPVLTDSNGNYTFAAVPAGSYTLTPAKSGYGFSPATRSVTVSTANVAGQNFTGYNSLIDGRVAFSNGVGIPNVEVRLNSGGRTAITNGAGYFRFTSMLNGAYTVTPVLAGYTFDPTYKSVVISNANAVNINFIGGYAINGRVANSSGIGLVGIRVYRTGSSVAALTNGAGYYAFYGVVNGSYTLTPDATQGYGYTPVTRSVTVAGASVNNQNFVGTTGYRVSGRIARSNGTPIPNVSVTRTGSATPVTTNGAGYYTFNGVPNGTYTLTPSLSGFTFAPASKSVTVSGTDPAAQNFIGTGP